MSTAEPLVLLVEDEPPMRRFLRASLPANGYRLVEAATAQEGLAHAAGYNPDIVLLDLGLPDGDGLSVLRAIREWSQVPVLVLSARGQEGDKVRALDEGADDYVTKPFGMPELLARMRAALRRTLQRDEAGSAVVQVRELRVDLARRTVHIGDAEVRLTPTEFKLLATLARHAGRVLTHAQLLKEVWGVHGSEQAQLVRQFMTQLRHKLETDPARPKWLRTEPGVGYRLLDQ
ncbi:MAG: response regulator [Gemmatimonadaceae bacterium]|jgi:two-component system KDP operon response regulator KdpE|nr:response regulator [Gemmatimonadaceae bacterium]